MSGTATTIRRASSANSTSSGLSDVPPSVVAEIEREDLERKRREQEEQSFATNIDMDEGVDGEHYPRKSKRKTI